VKNLGLGKLGKKIPFTEEASRAEKESRNNKLCQKGVAKGFHGKKNPVLDIVG